MPTKMSGATISEQLNKLGLTLPQSSVPAANYLPYVLTGNYLYISGQVPKRDGQDAYVGKLGDDYTVVEGQEAARLCALAILAHLNAAVDGQIDRVRRCVKLGGFVNSTPSFQDHPSVINGASDLIVKVLGEARSEEH